MATKPTELPRWATDGSNNDEPTEGRKDTGFLAPSGSPAVGDIPTSDEFNWLFNTLWLWVEFLNSAVVDFGTADVEAGVLGTDEGDVRHAAVEHEIHHGLFKTSAAATFSETKLAHGAGFTVIVPLGDLKVGDKITTARVRLNDLGGAGWVVDLKKMQVSTRTTSVIAAASGSAGDSWWTATPGTPETVATDYTYYLACVSGVAGGEAYGAGVTVKRDS